MLLLLLLLLTTSFGVCTVDVEEKSCLAEFDAFHDDSRRLFELEAKRMLKQGRTKEAYQALETALRLTKQQSNSVKKKKVAVVIPFVRKDVPSILRNFYLWNDTRLQPCSVSSRQSFDLILQFHKRLDDVPELQDVLTKAFHSITNIQRCFSSLRFLSADLSEAEDHHACPAWENPKVPFPSPVEADCSGPSVMFYKMFKNKEMGKHYDYFQLLEADTFPIRQNWLRYLEEEVELAREQEVWIRGARSKLCETCKATPIMNGNALYKVDDENLAKLLDEIHHKFWGYSYDAAISLYFVSPDFAHKTALIAHRIQYNTLVNDEYTLFWIDKLTDFPKAAFAHISFGLSKPGCEWKENRVKCAGDTIQLYDPKLRKK